MSEARIRNRRLRVAMQGAGAERDGKGVCERTSRHSFLQERAVAEAIRDDGVRLVRDLLRRVRLGGDIDVDEVQSMASRIIGSVGRNPDALLSLGRIRRKDRYTFEHSVNVAVLSGIFGRALNIKGEVLCALTVGALLHDLGKAFVPDRILKKPGRLTEGEFDVMRRHVVDTARVLGSTEGIPAVAVQAAAQHHERLDGSGYPDGLWGDRLSLHGQIVGICDVYDAITSHRCYREGEPPTSVLRKLLSWAGTRFEERLVHRFIKAVGIYPVGSLVGLGSGRLAVVLESGTGDLLRPVVRAFYDRQTRRYIHPERLDLAADPKADEITSFEVPERWGVSPAQFLDPG